GLAVGKVIERKEDAGPADVLLVATGVATTAALEASKRLVGDGVRCRVLHIHTIKPLDTQAIVAAACDVRQVVTVEEHSVVGGLGSAVLEALADTGKPIPPVRRLGIGDEIAQHYGNQQKTKDELGIHPPAL